MAQRELFEAWLAARGGDTEIVETHVSLVAFQGDRVYKLKKAVTFDFVDLATAERREALCRREVELNRRLAPDVYLGVVDVHDDRGTVVDHAIEMRRMPAVRRLSTLLAAGADVTTCLDQVGDLVVDFHRRAATSPEIARTGSRDAVASLWERGFTETRPFLGPLLDPETAARVEHLARRFLAGRAPLFAQRVASGRIRDGHGDLLTDDVFCLDDGPRVLDCLEFDDELRWGDVLADVAFLAMDLERLGRADLAGRFLDCYRTNAADDWPPSLAHHYVAYRAHVRAKVACLRHAQGAPEAASEARDRLSQCRVHLEAGRVRLVLVGGAPGTGKSTLAAALGEVLGWPVLRSDVVRKELVGLAPGERATAPLDEGLYAPTRTQAVYAELLDRAGPRLSLGASVILDASWSDAEHRERAAELAEVLAADVVALRCDAPAEVTSARVQHRLEGGRDASDATAEVAEAMAARFDPWPAATRVDTSGAKEEALRAALGRLGETGPTGSG